MKYGGGAGWNAARAGEGGERWVGGEALAPSPHGADGAAGRQKGGELRW